MRMQPWLLIAELVARLNASMPEDHARAKKRKSECWLPPSRRPTRPMNTGEFSMRLTPWLTGAGSRRLEGTNIGHENAEGMAYVGVRVEPTVRLESVVEGF